MSEPIVMQAEISIKDGREKEYDDLRGEVLDWVQRELPGTKALLHYGAEGTNDVSTVLIHDDADAADRYLERMGERWAKRLADMSTYRTLRIHGALSEESLAALTEGGLSGVSWEHVDHAPTLLGGFLR